MLASLLACWPILPVHDKKAADERFVDSLSVIETASGDERNFVKKAVNWALRNIGKRNQVLNKAAINAAMRIQQQGSRSARWIAADALRELTGEAVQKRIQMPRSGAHVV
jgi:3-methyladenine DNA glycosylase AlkD